MTSYTKALYRRDPKAADAFYKAQQFEHKLTYGRHVTLAQFTPKGRGFEAAQAQCHQTPFGKRLYNGPFGGLYGGVKPYPAQSACAANCGHPACKQGCTLVGSNRS